MRSLFRIPRRYLCTKKSETLVNSLVDKWKPKLRQSGIEDEEFFFKCILSKVLNVKFNNQINNKTVSLTQEQTESFEKFCECRMAGMPVQYIIGEWDFRDSVLKMVPPVFIPRPETENFVELILSKAAKDIDFNFLEVGCGSGAISLSILKGLPKSRGFAIDISNFAVELTKENAESLGLSNRLKVLWYGLSEKCRLPNEFPSSFDAIVSNPPYVKTGDLAKIATELLYEDIKALDGGRDGLDVIKNICRMSSSYLKPQGKLWMEVDESHPEVLKDFIEKQFSGSLRFIGIHNDLFGKERFVEIMKES